MHGQNHIKIVLLIYVPHFDLAFDKSSVRIAARTTDTLVLSLKIISSNHQWTFTEINFWLHGGVQWKEMPLQ